MLVHTCQDSEQTINMDLVLGWPCHFADGYVRTHEGTVSPTPTGRGLGKAFWRGLFSPLGMVDFGSFGWEWRMR